MANVLYITANPKPVGKSYSLTMGEEFLKEYIQIHPGDEMTRIDLYQMDIPFIDEDILIAMEMIQTGGTLDRLNEMQKFKIGKISLLVDQFIRHDKYIIVSPMWNFSFPPRLKAYLDTIVIEGKTFRFSEMGPIGLLKNKKGIHIQSSGGIYSTGPLESYNHSSTLLKELLGFLGITDLQILFVEGTTLHPDPASVTRYKTDLIFKAKQLAKTF